MKYFIENSLFSDKQYGFIKGRSTDMHGLYDKSSSVKIWLSHTDTTHGNKYKIDKVSVHCDNSYILPLIE